MAKQPWQAALPELAAALHSDTTAGLTSAQAAAALAQHGPNQLQEKPGATPLELFFSQFNDFIVWVLLGAAVISGFLGEWIDSIAIAAIIVLNAGLGFIQEYRAEKSLAALRRMASPVARVLRDGVLVPLPAINLVPGDVIELEAGDHVSADARLISRTANFAVQEASLTGESNPIHKSVDALPAAELPIGDRTNLVFMGTAVVAGRARVMIVATGMQTELGRIAGMIQSVEADETPLQKKLDQFGHLIVKICIVLVILVFVLQLWRNWQGFNHKVLVETFMSAVSLAVAAIPEGLPAVVTIALALGVQRMVRRHVLIRKLPSVETLGCATVICSDKTGTLTRNEMTVLAGWAGGSAFQVTGTGYAPEGEFRAANAVVDPAKYPAVLETLLGGVLCNGAALRCEAGSWKITGDPTEAALLTCAAKTGLKKEELDQSRRLVEELPFDSDRKRMSMLREDGAGRATLSLYCKGAPDVLLALCTQILTADGSVRPLTPAEREILLAENARLADKALRVLAIAKRPFATRPDVMTPEALETDLTFLGLLAMMDPPRQEVKDAVAICHAAGIRAVMITGDHKNTAVAVGRELGIATADSLALSGDELERLSDAELEQEVTRIAVYARVSPEHKLRIVRAWRKRGEVVAMTGDGVNDAPAVKEADIGVAMGITGTDVTKEVSDMVVTDDNFASIVAAVEEGRGIYDNIRKFVHYLLSCNAGEIAVMFMAALCGMPVPLMPVQLLWVNLVTDGLPALALGVDPVQKGVMKRPPRPPQAAVIGTRDIRLMIFQGGVVAACSLGIFSYCYYLEGRHTLGAFLQALLSFDFHSLGGMVSVSADIHDQVIDRARTFGFIVLAFAQDFHSYNCRSQTVSLFKLGIFTNKRLVAATLVSLSLNLSALYFTPLAKLLHLAPLDLGDLFTAIAVASIIFWVMEGVKALRREPAAA